MNPHHETPAGGQQPPRHRTDPTHDLRQRAEGRSGARDDQGHERSPEGGPGGRGLLHELRIHRMELEAQNEELRQAREALERAHARYFDLFDLVPVGYLAMDGAGLVRESNLAAARMLGSVRSALVGRPLHRLVHPRDRDVYWSARRRLSHTGAPQTCELRVQPLGGEPRWVAMESSPGPGEPESAQGWRAVLTDIDALKRAEESLREEHRRKDRFLAMLGHELRNPLAPIRSAAEILRLSGTSDPDLVRRLAEVVGRQGEHIARLVADLLDGAGIRGGTLHMAREPCDLRQAVRSAAEQIGPILAARAQHLDLTVPGAPTVVVGDAVRLAQAIANLLRNASQFSPRGARIWLTLEGDKGVGRVQVRDRGVGIDPGLLPRIFEPFVQADQQADRPAGGLGMGLPLVKGLAQLHGGTLEAQSPGAGAGSTFTLSLPLAAAPPPPAMDGMGRSPVPADPAARSVLVVEDNPDVGDSCVLLLGVLGHRACRAADGPAALAAVGQVRPDLILLDLGLPGMDGFEVARRLRATADGRAARLVAVTGYGQEEDIRRAREAGCDGHALKPMAPDTLREILDGCPRRDPG